MPYVVGINNHQLLEVDTTGKQCLVAFCRTFGQRNNIFFNRKNEHILYVKFRCLRSLFLWYRKSIVSDIDALLDLLYSFNLLK